MAIRECFHCKPVALECGLKAEAPQLGEKAQTGLDDKKCCGHRHVTEWQNSFVITRERRGSFYSKYFLKVSDEVSTGSTDVEFVCITCYFTLPFILETNFSM